MATRSRPTFNAPYNPQQWGPLRSSTSSPLEEATRTRHPSQSNRPARFAPRPLGPDEPVVSPPPPYSPRRDENQEQSPLNRRDTVSPSDTTSPSSDLSQHATPVSAATTMSPDLTSSYSSRLSLSPSQSYALTDTITHVSVPPTFPPPPPAAQAPGSRMRSSSKTHAERLLSTLGSKAKIQNTSAPTSAIDTLQANTAQALAQSPEAFSEASARAPAARRAASTGESMGTGASIGLRNHCLLINTPLLLRGLGNLLEAAPLSHRNDMLSLDETMHSPLARELPGQSMLFSSSDTKPQPDHDRRNTAGRTTTPTSPFSPTRGSFAHIGRARPSPSMLPTALTAPPPQPLINTQPASSLNIPPGRDERPISHLLHIPNSNQSIQAPLLPSAQENRQSIPDLIGPESPRAFAHRAVERHRNFAEREAAASSDSERLDLFIQFMVAESKIRREQYAAVFAEEDISVSEVVKGLFERQSAVQSPDKTPDVSTTEDQATSLRHSRTSSMSDSVSESNWHRSSSAVSRNHESPISISTDCSSQNRPESSWWNDYVPCLSPIASMSIVTGHDQEEVGSRGRASSRWWEDKPDGSANGDAFSVLKKSKRESKYMGLPKEARDSPALYEPIPTGSSSRIPGYEQSLAQLQSYGPHEYPPEKEGWHHQSSPLPPPPAHPPTPLSAPYTPDPRRLDISRFVTLPPPYPRHHPAVNNSHPDLAEVRSVVRSLHATEDADAIRATYVSRVSEKRQRANSWRQHQKSLHDQDIRFRMNHEDLSQSELERAKQELDARLHEAEKDLTQTDFDLFQNMVVSPLHTLFAERISKADITIEALSGKLVSDAQRQSPNAAQEEGDEQPELLEKLTQLKWLFEGRETLHRKSYDLLSERNEKYRAIVLLPYQQAKNHDKCIEAQTFFASDARDRRMTFEYEVSSRFDRFLMVIEANVTRGVEIQLSAFWDIAPHLHRVLSRVPDQLSGFEIQIPANEYTENPDYYEHPLQYLYSLLSHAQKSTYQFIESQINLLCLLHEIKSAATNARYQADEHRNPHEARAVETGRRREVTRLTEDLKEKVGMVEGQWESALGEELMAVRERVRCWLLENGGWDDENDEV
ncbi:MAG: hypothetical protein L6R36_003610 [Xanthoria steineri]|nr:MAG: hypothetical protein L6R36_003610 [Xanthoria steineri]